MRFSVLDQSGTASGRLPSDAIAESLALARLCDQLGYRRYWLAEHHNSASQAGTAPEILMAAIAVSTQHIRIGSAGVMLPHYSALKVAEVFRVLDALAPGRIDMGLGRAPGSDGRTAMALNPNAAQAAEFFPAQVRDVLAWTRAQRLPDGHPFQAVTAQPAGVTMPEPWILGSSAYGAQVAAHFGVPYCFAHFITDGDGAAEALDLYRDLYQPSAEFPEPHAALAVWALASPTAAEADKLFQSRALWRLGRDRGVYQPLPSVAEAEAYKPTAAEQARLAQTRARAIVGTGEQVAASLMELARSHGLDDVAVLTTAHDPVARQDSYRLLAAASAGREGPVSGFGPEFGVAA